MFTLCATTDKHFERTLRIYGGDIVNERPNVGTGLGSAEWVLRLEEQQQALLPET